MSSNILTQLGDIAALWKYFHFPYLELTKYQLYIIQIIYIHIYIYTRMVRFIYITKSNRFPIFNLEAYRCF
jgi:hypothetical protein